MPTDRQPPQRVQGKVLVVHGVGNQTRAETTETFADALGSQLRQQGYRPTVSRGESIFFQSAGKAHPAAITRVADNQGLVDVEVAEFHWAPLSSFGGSIANRLLAIWRIVVGLPKLGLIALDSVSQQDFLLRIVKKLFFLCWVAVVFRLLIFVLFISENVMCEIGSLDQLEFWSDSDRIDSRHRLCSMVVDVAMQTLFLLLGLGYMLSATLRRHSSDVRISFRIAITTLALTAVFTTHLPAALNRQSEEWMDKRLDEERQALQAAQAADTQQSDLLAGDSTEQPVALPTQPRSLQQRLDTLYANLYSVSRVSGLSSYVLLFLFLVAILAMGISYLVYCLTTGPSEDSRLRGDRLSDLWKTIARVFYLVSFLSVFAVPLVWVLEVGSFLGFGIHFLPAFPEQYHRYLLGFARLPRLEMVLVLFPLTNGQVRRTVMPLLELLLDVMSYFPGTAWLRRHPGWAYFLGAKSTASPNPLQEELEGRVHALAAEFFLPDEHKLLVGHSLGTVIIHDAIAHQPPGQSSTAGVELITTGSPLEKLHSAFPRLFPGDNLGLRSWHNLYRIDDYVGTNLPAALVGSNQIQEGCIGKGGHLGYFADPSVAALSIQLLTVRP